MKTVSLVLAAARWSGLAPCVAADGAGLSPTADRVPPRYVHSPRWRALGLAPMAFLTVHQVVGLPLKLSVTRWAWFSYFAMTVGSLCNFALYCVVVRRQQPKMAAVLTEVAAGLRRTPRGQRAAVLAVAVLLLVGLAARVVDTTWIIRDHPLPLVAFLTVWQSVGTTLSNVVKSVEACLFATLVHAVANQYMAVNARLMRGLLRGGGAVRGPRYDAVAELRAQHQRVARAHRALLDCFDAQVTLVACMCGVQMTDLLARLVERPDAHDAMSVIALLPETAAIFMVADAGQRIIHEGNLTFDLVHDALNVDGISAAEREELMVFSNYLVQRPVAIHLLGFITVNNTILIKAAGVIISYFLICLQF